MVDMLDLLEIQEHFGQTRQGPFLVLNPQGPPLADLHIAHGETPGAIRLYFTAHGPLDPFAFVLPQRAANLADLDRRYRAAAIDHQTQGEFHTLDIAGTGLRLAFRDAVPRPRRPQALPATPRYRCRLSRTRRPGHHQLRGGHHRRRPLRGSIARQPLPLRRTFLDRRRCRDRGNPRTRRPAGRDPQNEGLSFERRYLLALPPGDWTLHGALLTRGAAIDAIATAPVRVRQTARTDIADLTRLAASGRAIETLAGIEALSALRVLDLSSNAIAGITPLSALDGLDLADNQLSDLAALVANPALKVNDTIDLRGNQLSNLAIAAQLPALVGRRVFVLHRRAHRAATAERSGHAANAVIAVEEEADAEGPEPLTFADPQFEAAVREAIAKPLGALYPSDVANLTTLDARDRSISDLGGVENLVALEELKLNKNQISDVVPLGALGRLTTLHLNRNEITDINPLGAIDPLTELEVAGNQIADITVLARLKSFTKLALNDNQVADLSPLADLIELESLQLQNNQIGDLTPLQNLTGLRSLQLNNNQIADISALKNLTDIRDLAFSNNQVSEISALAGMRELTILSMENNQVANLGSLAGHRRLVLLEAANNQIGDLCPLANITSLQVLTLGGNNIRSLAPLRSLNGLTRVLAANNQIDDISGLANKAELFRVELDNNQIGDISALATLPTLDPAILDNNRITCLAPLAANPALRPGSIVFAAGNDIDANVDAAVIANLLERGISLQL